MITSTNALPASNTVTRNDIAQIEQLLGVGEMKSEKPSLELWFSIWRDVQVLSKRFSNLPPKGRYIVCADFKELLISCINVGESLVSNGASSRIELGSALACIEFLKDKVIQWFDSSVSETTVQDIWSKAA